MALDAVWDGGPGTSHFAITSACNARCGFCSFARDQLPSASRHSVTLSDAKLASDILKRNGIRFLHFTGGEPLVHPDFTAMVALAAQIGMITTLVTNGALLTQKRVDAGGRRPRVGLYFDRRCLVRGARLEPGPPRLECAHPSRHRIEATSNPEQRLRHDEPARRLSGSAGGVTGSRLWRGHIFLPVADAPVLDISPALSRRSSTSHPRSYMPLLRR
jgi:hypothetical protein